MRWRTFFFWNALGGIAWATSIGLAAYLAGSVVKRIIEVGGLAAVVVLVIAVAAFFGWRLLKVRAAEDEVLAAREQDS
jgi:membrane protein DedA with SNARE-associated domain